MGKYTMFSTRNGGLRIAAALCLAAWTSLAFADRMTAAAFQSALEAIAGYTIEEGENPLADNLDALDKAVIASHGDAALRSSHADALAALLADEDATIDAKWFAARNLYRIGGPAQVAAIAPLLADRDTSDIAIYALQAIPGEEATQALIEAFEETSGAARVGIINALAVRGDEAALPLLEKVAPVLAAAGAEVYTETERAELEAALHAIAKISGDGAEVILDRLLTEIQRDRDIQRAPADFFLPYYHAWLLHRLNMERPGLSARELGYTRLMNTPHLPHVETAAVLHWIEYFPIFTEGQPEEFLTSDVGSVITKKSVLWRIEDPEVLESFAENLLTLPRVYHNMLLEHLADHGIEAAIPGAVRLAGSPLPDTRILALESLGRIGTADEVALLLANAGSTNADYARAGAQALARIAGDDINQAIVDELAHASGASRVAAINALAARRAMEHLDTIWEATTDNNEAVRVAAYNALSDMGDGDMAVRLAEVAMRTEDAETREAAATAMVRLAQRTGTQAEVARASLDVLQQGDAESVTYASAIATLGRLDHPSTLPVLLDAARSPISPVQMAGIRALTNWPTAEPLDDVLTLAEEVEDPVASTLALRAAIGLVDKLENDAGKLAAYERTLAMDLSTQEVRRVLSGLARLSGPEALALAESFLDDDDLRTDAEFAVARIRMSGVTASASHNSGDAARVLDGNAATRWSTGELQHPGHWFQLTFPEPTRLTAVILNAAASPEDYPRGYAVYASDDGENWGDPIATGAGSQGATRIEFSPVTTSAIRIEQTGTADAHFWSIHTLEIETHE